jgi:hypothetical protein
MDETDMTNKSNAEQAAAITETMENEKSNAEQAAANHDNSRVSDKLRKPVSPDKPREPVSPGRTRRAGQPTKFKPEYAHIAYKFCLLRATDRELSSLFKVSEKTINKWKKQFPGFRQALDEGKVTADAEISQALFNRAKGYERKTVDIRVVNGKVVRTKSIRYYPPDVKSIMFWLKNRQPKKWRDKDAWKQGLDERAVEVILGALPPAYARAVRLELMKIGDTK